MRAGIDCVAVTDHNSGAWINQLKESLKVLDIEDPGGYRPLYLFPGVELSVGRCHYLAIFDPAAPQSVVEGLIGFARYRGTPGDSDGSCEASITDIASQVHRLNGVLIPAHCDQTTGIFEELRGNDLRPLLKIDTVLAIEIVEKNKELPAFYTESSRKWASVLGSDSHHPDSGVDGLGTRYPGSHYTWVKMAQPSLTALKLALHDGNQFSLVRSDGCDREFDPNRTPQIWIESLEIKNARLMGNGKPAAYSFSPWMNAIIGGRGSGKSTLIHFMRLATKRGSDLERLGAEAENRVLRTFRNFARKSTARSADVGGLREESEARLIFRKGEDRFRLCWLARDMGTTVETFDPESGRWEPATSQDVVDRFPLRIFSQDEIGLIAERPEALLDRVDEGIAKADWNARWETEFNRFMELLTKIRGLIAKLGEKDRLKAQQEDLLKQLGVFEDSEHAKVRKAYQKASRQKREMDALFEAVNELADRIGALREDWLLHDLPADIIDPEIPTDNELRSTDTALRAGTDKAGRILEKVETAMKALASEQRERLKGSAWTQAANQAELEHQRLIEALKEQGVEDPSVYTRLVARRQAVEKGLKEIEGTEAEIKRLRKEARGCRDSLLALRKELREMRREFLHRELGNNEFVRIELRAFGSETEKDLVERDLRKVLGCEGTRFSEALGDRERGTGLVEELFDDLPEDEEHRTGEVLDRLNDWKKKVCLAGRGEDAGLSGRFQNYLASQCASRPEFLDRLRIWWPEDSLLVSYSRRGDGQDFVPLTTGSAGEKAAALLAFFLAHGDSPLVIDQPENDLDNHLVTDLVVKQLKGNKQRRQIIVVTHNPNIVVNGDAEMIHAMEFTSGRCQAKASGALQEESVRSEVCAVMEGGRDALKSRFQRLI
ncbi:MAG: AAA family ATPase [Opitutales bacterium]